MDTPRPAWSVIIPTYNRADLLMRSVGSVLDQTFTDFEVFIVDDGSIDHTSDAVAAMMDERIIYLRQERNLGVAAARNRGLDQARGRFVAFLDSDDQWELNKLRRCDEFARSDESEDGWIGFHQTSVQGLEYRTVEPTVSLHDSPSFADFLILDGFIQTSAVFGPRASMTSVQFDQTYAPLEDWDWLMKQAHGGKAIRYLAECLSTHYADTRPGRLSAVVDPSVSFAWLRDHESQMTSRATAGFELLRIAPALRTWRPLSAIMMALRSTARLWRDFPRVWRPLASILLPLNLVHRLVRR